MIVRVSVSQGVPFERALSMSVALSCCSLPLSHSSRQGADLSDVSHLTRPRVPRDRAHDSDLDCVLRLLT